MGAHVQYREMGTPELRVSVVGFGGWPMGGRFYGADMDAEATSTIHAAIDQGINLFDTAAGYGMGHSEELMGAALRGRRDEVIVVTKFGIDRDESVHAYRRDGRPQAVRRGCERSLQNLGIDHIDVLLHHWPDPDTPIADTMGAAKELVDEGKVRFIGVSNYTPAQMAEASAVLPIVANQVGYHMLDRRHAERIFPSCEEHGVGVMAYGSLAHGVLAGQFTLDTQLNEDDWRATGYAFGLPIFHADHLPQNLEVVEQVASAGGPGRISTCRSWPCAGSSRIRRFRPRWWDSATRTRLPRRWPRPMPTSPPPSCRRRKPSPARPTSACGPTSSRRPTLDRCGGSPRSGARKTISRMCPCETPSPFVVSSVEPRPLRLAQEMPFDKLRASPVLDTGATGLEPSPWHRPRLTHARPRRKLRLEQVGQGNAGVQYREMGTPELRVSVVGFGGWPMGGRFYGAAMDR